MLRDNLVELIEPMRNSAGADPLALGIYQQKPASDDSLSCLENPRPEGAESSLTENVASPFPAEPRHISHSIEDGTLYFTVRFKDKTDFSLRYACEMFVVGADFCDVKTGNFKILREYMRPILR